MRLVWAAYHLALGTWFGAMVMLVIAAAITFKTVAAYQPTLSTPPWGELSDLETAPKYPLSVRILAGGIVGNVLKGLAVVQAICAVLVVLCAALQWAFGWTGGGWANLARMGLLAVPIVVLVADVTVISPRVWRHRQVMYDPARPGEERLVAKAAFDRLHKLNERLVGAAALSLAAALVVSAWTLPMRPNPTHDAPTGEIRHAR